jgi:hypothetical protein
VNCTVAPTAIEGLTGLTAIDVNVFAEVEPEHANMDMAAAIPAKRQNRIA